MVLEKTKHDTKLLRHKNGKYLILNNNAYEIIRHTMRTYFNCQEFAILYISSNGKRKLICDIFAMYDPKIIRRRMTNQNGNNYKCCLTEADNEKNVEVS